MDTRTGTRRLSFADVVVTVAALLAALSLFAPWLSLGGFVVVPFELLGVWALLGVSVPPLFATLVAGRFPLTRWLCVVPLGAGLVAIGILLGVAVTVMLLNPHLAGLPWQDANEVAQTVHRVASIVRLQSDDVDRLVQLVSRFAAEPQITLREGSWLFGASGLAMIAAGYRKAVQGFRTH